MCDTVVAPGSVTADGVTLFGKNSDREPNEAHHLLRIPAAEHPPGSTVRCTYIEIPQVERTYEVLLAKPFWIWGAEMGANEHGLVIGNEAVFTKVPCDRTPGLIGMDFLRLALERARTAREAVDVITSLLEKYGQGGNCGFTHEFYYHNSFLIADPADAWVLETAGRQWAAVQVKDIRTISNGLTIGSEWDLASDDLVSYAVERGWCKGRDDFHFARCYSDFLYTTFSRSKDRQCRTTDLLSAQRGAITVETIIALLRDHGPGAGPDWSPAYGLAHRQICQHAGFGPIRGDQTTGSMVSHLAPDVQTHFLTGTAAPCTSIFKPVWLGAHLPGTGPEPDGTYDRASLFWQHEVLHRATLRDYAARIRLYKDERDALEQEFIAGALSRRTAPLEERLAFSVGCFTRTEDAEAEWTARVLAAGGPVRQGPLYRLAWRGHNRAARMPDLR
ncbi:MAG TPA: peptidase U34 [Chloroflexi bacterium]|nr:peptidase U34 [Chloroflexota bacterium]